MATQSRMYLACTADELEAITMLMMPEDVLIRGSDDFGPSGQPFIAGSSILRTLSSVFRDLLDLTPFCESQSILTLPEHPIIVHTFLMLVQTAGGEWLETFHNGRQLIPTLAQDLVCMFRKYGLLDLWDGGHPTAYHQLYEILPYASCPFEMYRLCSQTRILGLITRAAGICWEQTRGWRPACMGEEEWLLLGEFHKGELSPPCFINSYEFHHHSRWLNPLEIIRTRTIIEVSLL